MIFNITSKGSYSDAETIPPFTIEVELTDTVWNLRKTIEAKLNEKPLWSRYCIDANGGGSASIVFTGTNIKAINSSQYQISLEEAGFSADKCNLCLVGLTLYRSPWGDE